MDVISGVEMWDRESEPPTRLKPEVNAASLAIFVDTNFIGESLTSVEFLNRCRVEGWVRLQRTDVIGTEHLTLPAGKEFKRGISAELAEVFTPMRLDYSRVGSSVLGSAEDESCFMTVFRILHPKADLATTRKNNIFDAMTVAGSARYGGDYLATADKGILKKSDALFEALAIRCLHPDAIADVVVDAIQRTVRNQPLTGWPKWMPEWRPENWQE